MNNWRVIFILVTGLAALPVLLIFDVSLLMNTLTAEDFRNASTGVDEFVYMVPTSFLGRLFGRSQSQQRIAIVVVIMGHKGIGKYRKAMLSVSCYARVQGYDFRILNSSHYKNRCPQKDGFFQRHCIAAHILTLYDYILFLDADFGVVNPKRRIEEYIDPRVDIIFYDRFYNWEITAGSYLAKNTTWSRNFLLNFATYEKRLPRSFHGTDNGALHAYVAEVVLGQNHTNMTLCLDIYRRSKNFGTLFLYEACVREVLGNNVYLGKIKLLPKGVAWARDNWLTNSLWSLERDFIIHGWKENQLRNYSKTPVPIVSNSKSMWYNPLKGSIDLRLCTKGNTSWHYDRNLLVNRTDIDRRLQDYANGVEKRKAAVLLKLHNLKNVSELTRVPQCHMLLSNLIDFFQEECRIIRQVIVFYLTIQKCKAGS